MSKKKNSPKKHKFKHVDAAGPLANDAAVVAAPGGPAEVSRAVSQPQPSLAGARDFSYVASDIRRIAIMAGVLVALELIFYYLLVFTPVGSAIYHLVKV